MKILQINDFTTEYGGAEKVVFTTKKLLEQNGHQIKIIGSERKNHIFPILQGWFSFSYYLKTLRAIKEFKPDIIHIHQCIRIVSPSVIIAAKMIKVPTVMTVHDFSLICPKSWMTKKGYQICKSGFCLSCLRSDCLAPTRLYNYLSYRLVRWFKLAFQRTLIKKNIDAFISPSEILSKWLKQNLGAQNIYFIPNFVESNKNIHPKNTHRSKQILFVGRLSTERGLDIALRGLKIIISDHPRERIFFEIVGDGPEKLNLLKLTKKLGIEKNVNFEGFVPHEQLYKFYSKADVFVFPSLCMDNFPLAIIEAMHFGLPVVASEIGGIPELVKNKKTGFLFPTGNYIQLAKKIQMIIGNYNLGSKLGKNSKKYASRLNKQIHYEKLIKMYNHVINVD